jgi:hypothetical protein
LATPTTAIYKVHFGSHEYYISAKNENMALEAISKKYKLSHLPLIVEKLNIENF